MTPYRAQHTEARRKSQRRSGSRDRPQELRGFAPHTARTILRALISMRARRSPCPDDGTIEIGCGHALNRQESGDTPACAMGCGAVTARFYDDVQHPGLVRTRSF
jgi:hypothetical protein